MFFWVQVFRIRASGYRVVGLRDVWFSGVAEQAFPVKCIVMRGFRLATLSLGIDCRTAR